MGRGPAQPSKVHSVLHACCSTLPPSVRGDRSTSGHAGLRSFTKQLTKDAWHGSSKLPGPGLRAAWPAHGTPARRAAEGVGSTAAVHRSRQSQGADCTDAVTQTVLQIQYSLRSALRRGSTKHRGVGGDLVVAPPERGGGSCQDQGPTAQRGRDPPPDSGLDSRRPRARSRPGSDQHPPRGAGPLPAASAACPPAPPRRALARTGGRMECQ